MSDKIRKTIDALSQEIDQLNLPEKNAMILFELLNKITHETDVINFKIKRILQDKSVMSNVLNSTIKELEEKSTLLEQQKKVIEKEAKFKEDLYAVVSHEMRTPLNGILGMGYLLSGTPLNPSQQKYTEVIKGSADKLIVIVNDLLNMTSANSGAVKIEKQPFYTAELFDNLEGILSIKTQKKGVQLLFKIAADFPPCLVGDGTRTYQILLNLLNNSVKFTQHGSVSLHSSIVQNSNGTSAAKFVIQDTGIGIKADKLDDIFERFTQVHDKKALNEEGVGLGLNIVKKLLNLMNGNITVSSQINTGTTMTVMLPFELPGEATPMRPEQVSDLFIPKDWQEKRFLLLEDNDANIFYINEIYAGWKLHLDVAPTIADARHKLSNQQYDCLLSDVHLPDGNGLNFIAELREQSKINSDLPVIILSGATQLSEETLYKLNIHACLNKPFTPQNLQSTISQIFDMHNMENVEAPSSSQSADIAPKLNKLSHLYQLFKGKQQHVLEMLDLFMLQSPPALSRIEQHIEDKNKKGIHYEAHTIKSTIKIMGLNDLAGMALRLEYCEPDTWEEICDNYKTFKNKILIEMQALEKERTILV